MHFRKLNSTLFSRKERLFIKQLRNKKKRDLSDCFTVEGFKSVLELFNSTYQIETLLSTPRFSEACLKMVEKKNFNWYEVSESVLSSLSTLQTNNSLLAVVRKKANKPLNIGDGMRAIVLDNIQDPSNLGSIIRTADWYGIDAIICSQNSVDKYNPKVIQASMGSFIRVSTFYTDIVSLLSTLEAPIIGAVLNGKNIHSYKLPCFGVLVLGNESKGISPKIIELLNHKLTIPCYGRAESLNVAVATAIFCDNWIAR